MEDQKQTTATLLDGKTTSQIIMDEIAEEQAAELDKTVRKVEESNKSAPTSAKISSKRKRRRRKNNSLAFIAVKY